jgi:Sulfotransferase domain
LTMKVIGAGLGRTGTSSLQAAMEILGFGPCYHMTEVFAHPEHVPVWEAAVREKPIEWESVLGGYRAYMGWPAAYEGLMERYPGAKVILTVRDPERWYESIRKTIYEVQRATESRSYAWWPC